MKNNLAYYLLFTILLITPFVFAGVDVNEEIVIHKDGEVSITGNSSYDLLDLIPLANLGNDGKIVTEEFTSKKGKTWYFEYVIDETFSDVNLVVELPEKASINAFESNLKAGIKSDWDVTTITFTGKNDSINIYVEYEIEKGYTKTSIFLFLVFIGLLFYFNRDKLLSLKNQSKSVRKQVLKEVKNDSKKEIDIEKLKNIRLMLNETQLKILDNLLDVGNQTNQSRLLHATDIPKASLSRNLEILAQKEVILKINTGNSNHIKLHPQFTLYRE